MTSMQSQPSPEPNYPSPAHLPHPWRILGPALVACGIVLLALGSPVGFVVGGAPLLVGLVAIERRASHMRDAALTALEARAPAMDRDDVEHHLAAILRIYGGAPFPSVKERVARIRTRMR